MRNATEVVEPRKRTLRATQPLPASASVDDVIKCYQRELRGEVKRLVRSSPRIAELTTVYPGMLAALASERGSAAQRREAIALIRDGAPLKVIARVLDLPMWLRRLPPDAFGALPYKLPQSEKFGRRIVARLPRLRDESAFWLQSVLFAERACDEDFATWLAAQRIFTEGGDSQKLFAVLAAYAWFSRQPTMEAHRLIVVPWRLEIAFDTALCAAKSWFNRVRLVLQLPTGVIEDAWLAPGEARGYTFKPLLNHSEILTEAQAMQNCADQYAERIVRGKCRLFSVQSNGVRCATLEIGQHPREIGVLSILQLKARHNSAATLDVWQAAYMWLAQQQGLKRIPPLTPSQVLNGAFDQNAWQRIMSPYRDAVGAADWFDTTASNLMFCAYDAEMADLARRGGVSSWLFT